MGAARMEDDQQFCLRWNNHQSTLVSVFDNLLEKGIHVDCTLAAEGKTLNAHKVVLSACSPYFESVLSQQFDKHPIIILKDVKYGELRAMMDYMYRGEVNISQDQLAALLKAAESLQIKGLSDNKPSRPPSHPAPAPAPPPLQPHAPHAALAALPTPHPHPLPHPHSHPLPHPAQHPLPHPAHHHQLAPDTSPQLKDGSIGSREGSMSPNRRRKKRRNSSEAGAPGATALTSAPLPTIDSANEDTTTHLKEENTRDGVEDLTIDEENDEPPASSHELVRNFGWHMDRSQDEITNDGGRDSQELRKDSHISSALLSLLSVQHSKSQSVSTVAPSCIQVTNLMKQSLTKDLIPFPPAVHLSKLTYPNALDAYPDTIKAQLLQQTFVQNNNNSVDAKTKGEDAESDDEYDDTDDILLPEEVDNYYSSNDNAKPLPGLNDIKDYGENTICVKQERSKGSEDRQFECRHCGKRYRWKSTLRRHENVECGGKAPSHQCPYCAYKAKQRGNLGVHIRKHHDREWFLFANRNRKNSKRNSAEPSPDSNQ